MDVPKTYQRASLAQADHVPTKLRGMGYRRVETESHKTFHRFPGRWPDRSSEPAWLHDAAVLEHKRWWLERATSGWRFGPERDNKEMRHNNMEPWEKLSHSDWKKDVDHVRALPLFIADDPGRYAWQRDVWIGCVGPVRTTDDDPDEPARIRAALEKALTKLRTRIAKDLATDGHGMSGNRGSDSWDFCVTLVTPLAPLVDVCFAEVGLQVFGGNAPRLVIPRPAPPAGDPFTNERLRELMTPGVASRSWAVDLLPPGFSERTVREWPTGTVLRSKRDEFRELQYQRGTAYLVERSDWLVLVERDGAGATPHVSMARDWWENPSTIDSAFSCGSAPRKSLGASRLETVIVPSKSES